MSFDGVLLPTVVFCSWVEGTAALISALLMVRPKPSNAKQDITRKLIRTFKTLISEGALASGQRLPPERDLAENFGVSRSSLRQALKVLEIMGVISQRVGDGTYLSTGAVPILGEPMEFLILLDGITSHELMESPADRGTAVSCSGSFASHR